MQHIPLFASFIVGISFGFIVGLVLSRFPRKEKWERPTIVNSWTDFDEDWLKWPSQQQTTYEKEIDKFAKRVDDYMGRVEDYSDKVDEYAGRVLGGVSREL